MAASIKTVLKIDDTELRSKLESVKKFYKQTYSEWADATDEVTLKQKEQVKATEWLVSAEKKLAQIGWTAAERLSRR